MLTTCFVAWAVVRALSVYLQEKRRMDSMEFVSPPMVLSVGVSRVYKMDQPTFFVKGLELLYLSKPS